MTFLKHKQDCVTLWIKLSSGFPNSSPWRLPVSLTCPLPCSSPLTPRWSWDLPPALLKHPRFTTVGSTPPPGMLLSHNLLFPHSLHASPCSNVTAQGILCWGPLNIAVSHLLSLLIPHLLTLFDVLFFKACQKWKYICIYLPDYFLPSFQRWKFHKCRDLLCLIHSTIPRV